MNAAPQSAKRPETLAPRSVTAKRASIVLLCTGGAISYGVLHDQITARLCLEYFTIAHPPLFPFTSPMLLALCWGVAATFGLGAILGILLAIIGHAGTEPPVSAARLRRPVARLLLGMALAALLSGGGGFFLSRAGIVRLPADLALVIPAERHDRFMSVWFAHCASYAVGLSGSLLLVIRLWISRGLPCAVPVLPRTPAGIFRCLLIAAGIVYLLWHRMRAA